MIRIMKTSEVEIGKILQRETTAEDEADRVAAAIIAEVAARGDAAVLDYEERFDRVRPEALEVTAEEIAEAEDAVDAALKETIVRSACNIRAFHEKQVRNGFIISEKDGIVLGQKITPIERAGLYIPGGSARYPSSVLMNAIPARIAGVETVVMTTPPGSDGKIPAPILFAAKTAGVDRIFKIGGAQAIAALALGTESVPKVDKIVGPGNVFVAAAKRRVFGLVNIDMIAGPSEILVLADGKSDPVCVAADLLSQAEHDKNASAVLITDSGELALAVQAELERQIPLLPRQEICRASIDRNGKIIVAADLAEGIAIANQIAPEHLEICTDDPFSYLGMIRNAGSIFLGRNCPEALGDYYAGPNHTLPTGGTARFSSPLSVDDFIKKSSYIYYSREALLGAAGDVERFAKSEGLDAHGESVAVRRRKG